MFSGLLQLNYMLFQEINAPAGSHPWFDALMIFCANSLIFFFPLLLIMVWGRPLKWRKRALLSGEAELLQERRALVLWVALACLLAFGLNLLIEQFVFEPRPFISHRVHLLVNHPADASFPSDHAAWSFAVVGMLLLLLLPPFIAAWRKRAGGIVRAGSPGDFLPASGTPTASGVINRDPTAVAAKELIGQEVRTSYPQVAFLQQARLGPYFGRSYSC